MQITKPLTNVADVYRLAPSRTLSNNQDLYKQLLELSISFGYLRDSIRSVSASYLKLRFTENSTLRWRVNALNVLQHRLNSMKDNMQEDLTEMKAILGCTALLLQYAVREIYHCLSSSKLTGH
jgi:hypothetical protein